MADKEKTNDLVNPNNEGFVDKVTPKEIPEDVFLFKCPNILEDKVVCDNVHTRHAGYVQVLIPFVLSGKKKVQKESRQVMVCTKCKSCYVWIDEQMYDVTNQIDLKAWEETEREMDAATGPGGEC